MMDVGIGVAAVGDNDVGDGVIATDTTTLTSSPGATSNGGRRADEGIGETTEVMIDETAGTATSGITGPKLLNGVTAPLPPGSRGWRLTLLLDWGNIYDEMLWLISMRWKETSG